jgi:hypothetical protein
MRNFPFNQEDKTRDCGYRCVYSVLNPVMSYEAWLDQFRFFNPVKSGIMFNDICTILDFYKIDHKFTQLTEDGLFIIYSGIWLHPEGKKHGHYFLYDSGTIYCSTHSTPYKMKLRDVISRLEAKTLDHAFRCLKIVK